MSETRAKIWLGNNKKNIIEVTATDTGIVMDVYAKKKNLIAHYIRMFRYIIFVKKPIVNDKKELAQAVHGFIDQYYEEEEEANKVKQQVLEDLELVKKEPKDYSYIG